MRNVQEYALKTGRTTTGLFRGMLFVGALLLHRPAALADCSNSGIWLWPYGTTLAMDQVMLINGYATSQDVIEHLGHKYRIYLDDGTTRIELSVLEVLNGQMALTQALLRPCMPLSIGRTYTLVIDDLPESQEQPYRWNTDSKDKETWQWTIVGPDPAPALVLLSAPREQKKTLVHYGCGPAEWVYFRVSSAKNTDRLVRVSVTPRGGHAPVTYILVMEKGIVMVGHGMCSGAFVFDAGDNYSAVFTAIDSAGADLGGPGMPVAFTRPVEPTDEE